MNRIDETFKKLRQEKKKAFIPYITAGDPDLATSKKVIRSLSDAGADIIELGIPFSDPLADGPTIQNAVKRSLDAGCTVRKVFSMVKALRRSIDTPFVFMTYYNIVLNYGPEKFVRDAKKNGADGIIVPDLPMEESEELMRITRKEDFHLILLVAPTTPMKRFKKIASASRGFIYYVSLTGVTGARKKLSDQLKSEVRKLKRAAKKPICVGFGISKPQQAKDIASASDGVIIGSSVINVLEKNLFRKNAISKEVGSFARSIARAIHGA